MSPSRLTWLVTLPLLAPAIAACATSDDSGAGLGGAGGIGGFVTGGTGGGGTGGTGGSGGTSATGGTGGTTTGGTGGAAGGGGVAGGGGAAGGGGTSTGGTGGTSTGGTGGTTTGGTGGTTTGGTGGTSTGGTGGTSTGGTGGTSTGGTGGTSTGGTGGTTGDTTPPTVTGTTPAGGTTAVVAGTNIVVNFDEAMLTSSITTNTAGTTCTGSIQVSKDNFTTCAPMSAAPTPSAGNTAFTLNPSGSLESLGNYKIRVTTAAKDASGNALAATYTTPTAFVVRYFHTITIDGVNDFVSNEAIASSSSGYTGYVAWDSGYVYFGMSGPDVSANSATKWLLIYLSGSPNTTTGVKYNTQQPTLPFAAGYHVRWQTNNVLTNAQKWSSSAWADAGWSFTGDVYQSGNFVEIRVPFVDIGSPASLDVHMSMINEQGGVEGSYAAVPASSFTDGYDPNYTKYFSFDLSGSVAPNASPVK